MESDKIEKLLEKYFEATTTLAEEETLQSYFSQENVAANLEKYAPMFQFFSGAKKEKFTKQVPLDTIANVTKKRFNYRWLSVAATVLVLFGIYFGNDYLNRVEEERIATEYAYQETKKAMNLLAQNFNRGTEKVAYLNQFEETKQKVYNK